MSGRWREGWARLVAALRGTGAPADLDDELQAHLDLAAAELERSGLAPDEARRRARAQFGSVLAARERVHDQQGVPWIEHLAHDVRDAVRGLRRTPGFTAAAVVVLGAGIAVNLAVFTVTNATLFKGFRGVPDQDGLVYVTAGRGCCLSYLDLLDWREAATGFSGLEAVADQRVSIDTGDRVDTATATEVTAGLFRLLHVAPILGRDFTPADDRPGAARVALLHADFWRTRFDGDPAVVGRTVTVNGEPATIVGVMPPGFFFPQRQDLWMPMGPRVSSQPRDGRGLWVAVARLAGGTTLARARAEMAAVGTQIAAEYPATNTGVAPAVYTFAEFFIGPDATTTYGALWAGVGVLLLIACANMVTLLLARSAGRTREVAVRLALGAGRLRVARLHLVESLLLAAAGGLLAWGVSPMLLRAYAAVAIAPTQPWASQLLDFAVDGRALAYLVVVVTATAVVTGLVPALRSSQVDVHGALRDGTRGAVGHAARRGVMHTIVAAQVGLAVVLLSAAGVLVHSFLKVHLRPLGYDPSRVLVALSTLPRTIYPDPASQSAFFERTAAALRALPGIESVAMADGVAGQRTAALEIEIEGRPPTPPDQVTPVRQSTVSEGYFATLGGSIVAGRDFDRRDDDAAPPVAIVNRRFAALHWGTEDVIGRRLRTRSGPTIGPWLRVVGVASDMQQGDRARAEVEPSLYRAMRQRPRGGAWWLARTTARVPPRSLVAPMRRAIQATDPAVPVWLGPYTLEEWNAGTYWKRGLSGGLFLAFAVVALGLAATGVLAVTLAGVAGRRQEISVRIALGANAAAIVRLVAAQGAASVLTGVGVGLVASLATNRLLASQLVDVDTWDPPALIAVVVAMLAAAVLGGVVPAVQATRVDPLQAMRGD